MAIPAFLFLMRPLQFISCKPVIELVLIKADNLEITAMMVVMACIACFSFYLGRRMVTAASADPFLYGFMACKAFFIGDLITEGVAFGAVAEAFQVGMYL